MKLKLATIMGGLALVTASNAYAVPLSVTDLINTGVSTVLSDNSAESLVKGAGNTGTLLEVGDRLRGMFTIGTIEHGSTTTAIGGGTGYKELTGVFEIEVASKLGGGGGPANFTFKPYVGFATEMETLTGKAAGSLSGAMVTFFTDAAQNYSRVRTGALVTTEDLLGTARDGSYFWTLGFTGVGGSTVAGEGWSAFSFSDDVGAFTAPGAFNAGLFNYGLNLIDNATFIKLGDVTTGFGGVADLSGSGSLISPLGFNTPFDVWDNIDMTINPVVPEPGTFVLLGAGLAGLGLFARRRARN